LSPRRPPVAAIAHAHSERSEQGAMADDAGQRGRYPRRLSGVVGAHVPQPGFPEWRDAWASILKVIAAESGFSVKQSGPGSRGSVYLRFKRLRGQTLLIRLADHRSRSFNTCTQRRRFSVRPSRTAILLDIFDKLVRIAPDLNHLTPVHAIQQPPEHESHARYGAATRSVRPVRDVRPM